MIFETEALPGALPQGMNSPPKMQLWPFMVKQLKRAPLSPTPRPPERTPNPHNMVPTVFARLLSIPADYQLSIFPNWKKRPALEPRLIRPRSISLRSVPHSDENLTMVNGNAHHDNRGRM